MMNAEQIEDVMRALAAAYPSTQLTEDMVRLWRESLATEDASVVAAAVSTWIKTEQWWPSIAELRAVMRDHQREERGAHLSGRVRCNGYGWIEVGDEGQPCPTCNKALWRVMRDEAMLALWRDGRPLHVVFRMSKTEFAEEFERPSCTPPPGGLPSGEREVSVGEGRAIAERAYLAQCRAEEREPNEGSLRLLRGIGR